jgi:hypothetical protein
MPTTIVDYNKGITSFLQDVNYGMSKPQFNHLCKFEAKMTGRHFSGLLNRTFNCPERKIADVSVA